MEPCEQPDPFGTAFYGDPPVSKGPSPGNSYVNKLANSNYGLTPIPFHHPTCFHFEEVSDPLELVPEYRKNWVLIIGGMAEIREQTKKLGFNKALISSNLTKESAKIYPLQITASVHEAVAQPKPFAEQSEPISAVLIVGEPQNWHLDLQILLALSVSGDGTVGSGARAGRNPQNLGYQHDCTFKIHCLNLDFESLMAQNVTRIAKHAFLHALQYMWGKAIIRRGF